MNEDRSLSGSGSVSGPKKSSSRRGSPLAARFSWTAVATAMFLAVLAALLITVPAGASGKKALTGGTPIYLDPSYTFQERAADLVARLTPAQRAAELVSSQAPEISNLTNPLLSPTQAASTGSTRTTLIAPTSVGDTAVKVSSMTGMTVGRTMQIDSGGTPETVTVSSVGTGPGTAGTLVLPAGAGDSTIFVSTTSGATVGHQYRVDVPPNVELGTVATVGTAAGTAGTLPIGASAGDTTIYVSTISGAAAGHKYKVDAPPNMEVPTIATVGTAAATATTLPAGANAGDTNIKVASTTGMTVGHKVRVDTGATLEVRTISAVGSAAATATTLAAPAGVGDMNIKVTSTTGMTVGHQVRVDTGAAMEIGTITVVGTSGSGGTGVTLAAPLAQAHANGAGAQDLGTGVTLTSALAQTHAIGAGAQDLGTGITLTAPLTGAHAIGAAIQDLGTGIVLSAPLGSAHAVGAAIQPAGTGITLAAPLAAAHAYGAAVQDTGTGVTVAPALTSAHPYGAFVDVMTGIPAYGWWNEALHGINAQTYGSGNATTLTNTTSYPIDLSRGSSWDPALTYQVAQAESDEAREIVPQNKLNLDFYSPTVNIGRDPRWGRNDESYGEDPLLAADVASEFVDGMEGKDQNGQLLPAGNGFYKATTTLKHYALNNTEGSGSGDPNGRLNVNTVVDERTIREYYTMQFRKIVQMSQPGAIMSSYNSVNGDPAAANSHLIDTLMRQTFGFQGFFTGDCDAVNEINARHHWQPTGFSHVATVFEQFAFSQAAGEDVECNAGYSGSGNYRGPTAPSTSAGGAETAAGMQIPTVNGTMSQNTIDVSATRAFTNRMKLGEFDPNANVPWLNQAIARDKSYGVYPWSSTTAPTETADRLALAQKSADAGLVLLKNQSITRKDSTVGKLLPIQVPPTGSFKVLVLGPLASVVNLGGYSSGQSGAGAANNITPYAGIKAAIQAVNPAAQVDFLRGFTGTSTSASSCCGTIDPTAVTAAAGYDDVIVFTGMDTSIAQEDLDRTSITLPGQQGQLIAQVAAANPNTVAVMQGDPFDVSSFASTTPAIVWSSYNGQRQGAALADVLLGAYNPSGRTPETFYQDIANNLPPTTNYAIRQPDAAPYGRTYMYYTGPICYPFGYGLSYSTFTFSNLHIDNTTPSADDTINVSVDVTNSAGPDGNEIVEMYVNQPNADPSLQRPIKRLEGFQKVFLTAGQTKTVSMPIKIADLAFFSNADNRFEVDDGVYGIQISTSAADADIQQQGTITVSGNLTPKPMTVTAKPRIATSDVARGIAQRVIFPENVDVDPGLTVAMNDDSLFGFIEPGQSKPLPTGATVTYTSDRPDIVSVSGGTIHTVANGAASITATVTYNGKSASTTFPLRVVSDLGSISYDTGSGPQPVPGFLPTVTTYDVILPSGGVTPTVTASAPSAAVAITQPSGVPGTATITATGPEGIVATYKVNFAVAASNDEFNGTSLDPRWTVVHPDPANLSVGGGSLTITPEAGQLTTNNATLAKNLVLEPGFGDFTETTKVTFNQKPTTATQQAGLLAYQDDDNYFKFDVEATSATNIQLNTSMEDSSQTDPVNSTSPIQVNQTLNTTALNSTWPSSNTIYLRIHRHGSVYSTYYSYDGSTWTAVWSNGATLSDVMVGPYAYSAAAAAGALTASFDFFHVNNQVGAPVTTASYAPPAVNGWFEQNPTVTLTGVDNSGVGLRSTTYTVDGGSAQTYTAPFVISGDGTHTLTYFSTDNDGTVEPTNTDTVKIDTTPPTIGASLSPAPVGGYYSNPTVTLNAADATSGVALTEYNLDGAGWQIYTLPFQVTGDGSHTLQYRATDAAGNQTTNSTSFQVDGTAPTTTASAPCSSPGLNGWCLVAVQVTLSATDATSGVPANGTQYAVDGGGWTTYTGPFTISADKDHLVQFMSTDNAGNVEVTKSIHVKVDQTDPVTTAALSPAPQNSYYASPTLTLTGNDGTGSGIASISYNIDSTGWHTQSGPGPVVLSSFSTNTHIVQYKSTDNAGRVEGVKFIPFAADSTPPNVNLAKPSDGDAYPQNSNKTAVFTCSDNGSHQSGITPANCTASQTPGGPIATGGALNTSTVGPHSVTATGKDNAGNVTTVTHHYTVAYRWNGMNDMPDPNPAVLNIVHWGDKFKIKFNLIGETSTSVLAGTPTWTPVSCPSLPLNAISASSVPLGLTYDATGSGNYQFGVDSSANPGWQNACEQFSLTLNDGTAAHTAVFMFFYP